MFKLVKLAFVVGALAAVWMLVPIHGRTLDARWSTAGSPGAFAKGAWAELDKALSAGPRPAPAPKPGAPARPTEAHTERDRQAVDKIVAEHLRN